MAQEIIDVGTTANDGQGDPIRTAFIKTNNNFSELYARAQPFPPSTLVGKAGDQAGMYAYDSEFFYYCYQDYDGSSDIWNITSAATLSNGNSSVTIPTPNGPIFVTSGGVSNVAVFNPDGVVVTGNVNATRFIGDGTFLSNINYSIGTAIKIINGNSNVTIGDPNGNVTFAVNGTDNIVIVSTLGANITRTTAAINTTTGALIVAGGVGVGGNLYAAQAYSNGSPVLTDTSVIDCGTY